MKKILVPVDETVSTKTMDITKEMALKFDAEIVVLHVKHRFEVDIQPFYADTEPAPEVFEEIMKYEQDLVLKVAETFDGTGIKVSTEVLKGHAASKICDYAKENMCDLIIMNSHGHSAVERFLIGGVTSKVVHHAEVPVLVVRWFYIIFEKVSIETN